jgi:hypothetical protein
MRARRALEDQRAQLARQRLSVGPDVGEQRDREELGELCVRDGARKGAARSGDG